MMLHHQTRHRHRHLCLVELIQGLVSYENVGIELVLLTDILSYPEILDFGIKIHILKRKIKKDPTIFYKLNKICKTFNPDIINGWGLMPSVYSIPIAKWNKIKFINSLIASAPDSISYKTRVLTNITFFFSDKITSNSYAGLQSYNVQKSNGVVIYNGYDFSRSKNLTEEKLLKTELNINTKFIVGMVAGFRIHKDYKSFIIAANKICLERKDITFLLVGDGPKLEENKNLAASERIIFSGERNDVESLIDICDIGVLSTYTEGISNSILEFMALGKPVVATDGGGTKEIVLDGETGYLVKKESPDMLKEKILYLLDNNELRNQMGNNAKKNIETKFNIDKMIIDYYNLFRTTLERS